MQLRYKVKSIIVNKGLFVPNTSVCIKEETNLKGEFQGFRLCS